MISCSTAAAFALNPNLPILKHFFLPNRNGAFQFANCPLAGFKGSTSVRSADGDNDAGLADFQTAGAMNDADVGDVESLVSLPAQSFHLAQSHRLVGFVNEIECAAATCPFARIAIERDGRAAFGEDNSTGDCANINWIGS